MTCTKNNDTLFLTTLLINGPCGEVDSALDYQSLGILNGATARFYIFSPSFQSQTFQYWREILFILIYADKKYDFF